MKHRGPLIPLLLTGGLWVTGAAPPADDPAPRVERATAELVLIEAYVTDRQDHVVRGLGPEEFVLKVDGITRPISSVEFRDLGAAGPPPAPSSGGTDPAPGGRPPSTHPRRFVLFFDDETSSPQGLGLARKAAGEFLAGGLLPDDQVAVVAYRRRLVVLHDFSTDRDSLRRAATGEIDDVARVSLFSLESLRRAEEFAVKLRTEGPSAAASLLSVFAHEDLQPQRRVLQALSGLVDSLAAWPGYKGLIVMGDGLAEYPAQAYIDRLHPDPVPPTVLDVVHKHNLTLEMNALMQSASGSGVTIHTVQTSGLLAGKAGDLRAERRRSNSLESLALNTGGVSWTSNDLGRGLSEADRGSRSYYVIGYAPEGPADGLFHSVRLRVKRGGLRLRYRTGFTRFTPEDAHRRAAQAAYLLPEMHRDLGVTLTLVEGPADGSGRAVDLVVHVPPGRVLFLPQAGQVIATLEAGFVAIDDAARETLRMARRIRLALPPGSRVEEGSGLNLFARVRLPFGPQTITAVLSDFGNSTFGAARAVLAPRPAGASIQGLSLYSLSEQSLWVELRRPEEASGGLEEADFEVGPALRTVFRPDEPVACGFRALPFPHLRLEIRGARGEKRLLELEGGSGAPVKVTIPTTGLQPGDYLLVVREGGAEAGVDRGSLGFSIRAESVPPGNGVTGG
jgi:VWFA-related protein